MKNYFISIFLISQNFHWSIFAHKSNFCCSCSRQYRSEWHLLCDNPGTTALLLHWTHEVNVLCCGPSNAKRRRKHQGEWLAYFYIFQHLRSIFLAFSFVVRKLWKHWPEKDAARIIKTRKKIVAGEYFGVENIRKRSAHWQHRNFCCFHGTGLWQWRSKWPWKKETIWRYAYATIRNRKVCHIAKKHWNFSFSIAGTIVAVPDSRHQWRWIGVDFRARSESHAKTPWIDAQRDCSHETKTSHA